MGAHHLDLRGPHVNDTEFVKAARELETVYIGKWIDEYNEKVKELKK